MTIRFLQRRRRGLIAGAAGLLLVAGGGIAYATIPDGNGVIHGCYGKKNGSIRVVLDGGRPCNPKKETALEWSQTGPAGPAGPQGPPGPTQMVTFHRGMPIGSVFDPVTLVTVGPFTLQGRCWQYQNGDPAAPGAGLITVTTGEPGHIVRNWVSEAGADPYEQDVQTLDGHDIGPGMDLAGEEVDTSSQQLPSLDLEDFSAVSADGQTAVLGRVGVRVNPGLTGDVCLFFGEITRT
jgi:hypothetical protein